jgi:hypothetical protein
MISGPSHGPANPLRNASVTAASAAAAAEFARRRREEEESLTGYTPTELAEGWEFKILHSSTSAFRKTEAFRQAVVEERRAGWVLVEKFDNQRLRFKRPASARSGDGALGIDPYRTSFGMSQAKLTAVILATVFGTMGVAILITVLAVHK